jgi:hypothetical protein
MYGLEQQAVFLVCIFGFKRVRFCLGVRMETLTRWRYYLFHVASGLVLSFSVCGICGWLSGGCILVTLVTRFTRFS